MKKKTLLDRLKSLHYMQVSLGLFSLALLLSLGLLVHSAVSGGSLLLWEGLLGIVALVSSLIGLLVALYGHYIVRSESRVNFRLGVICNTVLLLWLVFLYFLGMQP